MRVNSIIQDSIVDGTGLRLVVFMQGCKRRCVGCHNPSTWDINGGFEIPYYQLTDLLKLNPILDGITFTGGEPFEQIEELYWTLDRLKKELPDKSVWVYTGYKYEDLYKELGGYWTILDNIDVLVDGPFEIDKRTLAEPFKGSSNQRIIDVQESLKRGEVVLYEVV